eukprot:Seg4562.3 transcript_id=Seg4562.3/GoldUCD/mRNA.D3Y31 product="ATP-dependent helicase SGS1" protein_id=Seg4562.3/GoldUCD/D3Y31
MIADVNRKVVFKYRAVEEENLLDDEMENVDPHLIDSDDFWAKVLGGILSKGLNGRKIENFFIEPRLSFWLSYIGPQSQISNLLVNSEHRKVNHDTGEIEIDCRELSEERLIETMFERKHCDLQKLARKVGVNCKGSKLDIINRVKEGLAWLEGKVCVMCSTSAFVMGIDKGDVRFVIHDHLPPTVEDLVQESGRSGRDGQLAFCWIFFKFTDGAIHMRNIASIENMAVQEEKLVLLNQVSALCYNSSSCFQKLLAEHFQYDLDQPCGICRNCQRAVMPGSKEDMTVEAKGVVACLRDLMHIKARVTKSELVLTHIGSKAKDVFSQHFDKCEHYGKGKAKFKSATRLSAFVEHLIIHNVIKEHFKSLAEKHYLLYLSCETAHILYEDKIKILF